MASRGDEAARSDGSDGIPGADGGRGGLIVDLGHRFVRRPLPDDRIRALAGRYAGRGPTTDMARAADRAAEAQRERTHG